MGDCTTGADKTGAGEVFPDAACDRALSLFFDARAKCWAVELRLGGFAGELVGRREFSSMDGARDFFSVACTDVDEGGEAWREVGHP